MAAATVTYFERRRNVNGFIREINDVQVVFANNGDTWTVPGIKQIYSIDLVPTTNASYGFTYSGNTMTLVSSAGLTFSGSVSGL